MALSSIWQMHRALGNLSAFLCHCRRKVIHCLSVCGKIFIQCCPGPTIFFWEWQDPTGVHLCMVELGYPAFLRWQAITQQMQRASRLSSGRVGLCCQSESIDWSTGARLANATFDMTSEIGPHHAFRLMK